MGENYLGMAKNGTDRLNPLKTETALSSGHQMAKGEISNPEPLRKVPFVLL